MQHSPDTLLTQRIFLIRGHRVLLDSDLAQLYGVEVKRLNEQVKRNLSRFPADFMFELTPEEHSALRSQIATLRLGHGKHRKHAPFAFTEQGVAMLSSVLHSERAIQVNIEIMRAFIRLRELSANDQGLAKKLMALERKYDGQFKVVFDAIRQLVGSGPPAHRRKVGFKW